MVREIDLEVIISQTDERKGKEAIFLGPKASRCMRQHSKVPPNIQINIV